MSVDSDWLRGSLQTIVLQIVMSRPLYGYEICKVADRRTNGLFELREGSLYPALHKLERDGLLAGYWEQTDQGRRRKYYRITPTGQEHLQRKQAEWREFSAAMNAVLGGAT